MISFKKAVFALSIGIGLSASVQAFDLPDCQTCEALMQDCIAGDRAACDVYNKGRCNTRFLPGTCSY